MIQKTKLAFAANQGNSSWTYAPFYDDPGDGRTSSPSQYNL